MSVEFSIVVPIYCEQENLERLYSGVKDELERIGRDFELIFVDDGSHDGSLAILRDMSRRDPRVRIVCFSRNFGHQIAITAGMKFSRGDSIIIMDGDLQDPPEILPELIKRKEEGNWDIVYAVRKKRQEPFLIRSLYFLFYRLLKTTSYIDIPLDAGDFCVMSRRVVDQLNRLPERTRFVRGLRSWVGFRQTGLEYERAARGAGKTKYGMKALFKLAFDAIFSFSYLPLRISTLLGLAISLIGLLYALFLVVQRITGHFEGGWTTVVVSVLVLGGVQLVMLGIIGEYLGRVFEELKGRPHYVVEEMIGFDDTPSDDA
ncbi:glycosyltransferase family 2 protein [Candidatus Sumerlaeota bacterium]|nr:glycosyltransferase family 2 protein [Candidatus Sumerlaeota bacterium]